MHHQQYLRLQAKPTNEELAFKDHFHHLKKGNDKTEMLIQ